MQIYRRNYLNIEINRRPAHRIVTGNAQSGEGGEHFLGHVVGLVVIVIVAVLSVLTNVAPVLPLLPCLVSATSLPGAVGAALGGVEQPAPVLGCAANLALHDMGREGGNPLQGRLLSSR